MDIDGPMIPARAYLMPENHGKRVSVFDPIAVAMVRRLLILAKAKLVISSAWRVQGREKICELLSKNGIDIAFLHDDWSTGADGHAKTRMKEIEEWLSRHPEVKTYVALDDEGVGYMPGGVQCTFEDGLTDELFSDAARKLGISDIARDATIE